MIRGDLQHTAAPVVTDGVVYFSTEQGSVYAVDMDSQQQKWRFDTEAARGWRGWLPIGIPGPWLFTSPSVAEGTVYFGSYEGGVYAVDADTGQEIWRFPAGKASFGGPTLVEDSIYVASWQGDLHAITTDGQERWRFEADGGFFAWPAPPVVDDAVYVGSDDGHLYAVDRDTGEERWRFATGDAILPAPTGAGDLVIVGSEDGPGYGVDRVTGEQVWRHDTGAAVGSPPSHVDGTVYLANDEGTLVAVDAQTGRERWSTELGGVLHSPIVVVDGTVAVASHEGSIFGVEATTGRPTWTFDRPAPKLAASLTAVDDQIPFTLSDATLHVLDPQAGQARQIFTPFEAGP